MTTEERKNNLRQGMMGGLVPPQVQELERAVLGSIIDVSDYLIEIADIIRPEHFYNESNKLILEAILRLSKDGNPIDMMTVVAELRKMGKLEMVGGATYVMDLVTQGVRSGTKIEFHTRIIIQKYMQREMIRISQETIRDSYDDTADVLEIIERNQNQVFLAVSDTHKKNGNDIGDLLLDAFLDLELPQEEGLSGVGSGFRDLDAITGGWQPSDLIIIAARPAMGKTAFCLKCARNAAVKFDKPTVVFSLEMSAIQLTNRMLSDETSIKLERILKRRVSADEITLMKTKVDALVKSKLIIDDSPSLNVFELRAKCRRLKAKSDIQLIIVDYLQLMSGGEKSSNNRDNEIGIISRALKSIAKELNVPVIALSQLSRKVDERPVKRPLLSDLRESGNIEQDADMVLFLYRPEYYGVTGQNGQSVVGLCEVIIAKNRNGVTDVVNLDFNGSMMRFKDWFDPKKKIKSKPDGVQGEIPIQSPEIVPNYLDGETEDLPF